MGANNLPNINEIVNFLGVHAPAVYAEFSGDAQLSKLMELGLEGGPRDAQSSQALRARVAVLSAALSAAIPKCAAAAAEGKHRLGRARQFRFMTLALGAVGASSVIGTAFYAPLATVVAGVLTLASNIAGVFTDQIVLGQKVREEDVAALVQRLVKAQARAELTGSMLAAVSDAGADGEELVTLIQEANALFEESPMRWRGRRLERGRMVIVTLAALLIVSACGGGDAADQDSADRLDGAEALKATIREDQQAELLSRGGDVNANHLGVYIESVGN